MTDDSAPLPDAPEPPQVRPVNPIMDRGKTVVIKSTGERALLIGGGDALRGTQHKAHVYISTAFSRHMYRGHPLDDLEIAEPKEKRGGYDLQEDFEPITSGLRAVPNFEPWKGDPLGFLNNLTLGGLWIPPSAGYAEVFHEGQTHKGWARFFLRTLQGGGLDGTGAVIIYQSPKWDQTLEPEPGSLVKGRQVGGAIIGHFAICKHKKVDHADANHMRGWHPGHCSVCGMNMTVDSGD